AWLLDLLTAPEPDGLTRQKPNGAEPTADLSGYAGAELAQEIGAVASAEEGKRNDQLNRSAFSLGQLVAAGLLNSERVEGALLAAAIGSGLGQQEAIATIKSGLDAGSRHPREVPEPNSADSQAPRKLGL